MWTLEHLFSKMKRMQKKSYILANAVPVEHIAVVMAVHTENERMATAMAECKAWLVREKGEFCATVIFAETRGKARSLAKFTDGCMEADFINIEVRRMKDADKYYTPGKFELSWDIPEERIALVKDCGFTCDPDARCAEECADCPAKEFCDDYLEMEGDGNG